MEILNIESATIALELIEVDKKINRGFIEVEAGYILIVHMERELPESTYGPTKLYSFSLLASGKRPCPYMRFFLIDHRSYLDEDVNLVTFLPQSALIPGAEDCEISAEMSEGQIIWYPLANEVQAAFANEWFPKIHSKIHQ